MSDDNFFNASINNEPAGGVGSVAYGVQALGVYAAVSGEQNVATGTAFTNNKVTVGSSGGFTTYTPDNPGIYNVSFAVNIINNDGSPVNIAVLARNTTTGDAVPCAITIGAGGNGTAAGSAPLAVASGESIILIFDVAAGAYSITYNGNFGIS